MESVLSAVIALTFGWILTVGASLTGNQDALCKAMGGVYTPAPQNSTDVCPGGKWAGLIIKTKPEPQK